jgi:hypothetical protein
MDYLDTGAVFSPCETYRYRLWRAWDNAAPRVVFIGLNPSTADVTTDDPTIRRCVGFAKAWSFGGIEVVNLFAFRATEPKNLKQAADPVGLENDAHLLRVTAAAGRVVAAWGVHGTLHGRAEAVLELLKTAGVTITCLARTRAGHPRHPLYAKASLRSRRYFAPLISRP